MSTDSQLWDADESDRFTARAHDLHQGELVDLPVKAEFAQRVHAALAEAGVVPTEILEVGCAYGANLHHLANEYPTAHLTGIDPGTKSIATAQTNIHNDHINFQVGHAHELPLKDCSVDLVLFSMVLQWIPRSHLMLSLAETDRILKPGGAIVISDFLPDAPLRSVSRHNSDILIFKEDYAQRFSAPNYQEVVRQITRQDEGPDHRSVLSVLVKNTIEVSWPLRSAARETSP